MKVLSFGWFFYPRVGGAETVMKIISDGLAERGYDVTVVCSGKKFSKEKLNKIKIVRTPLVHPKLNNIDELREWFQEFVKDFDVVHCHNLSYPHNVEKSMVILQTCNRLGIPVIEHSHNAQLKKPWATRKIIKGNLYKILCVSNFVRKRLEKIGVKKERLQTVYNAIDLKLFNPSVSGKKIERKIGTDSIKIFFPGRVIRISTLEIGNQKQFKNMCKALSILKKEGIDFTLVIPGIKDQPLATKEKVKKGEKVIKDFLEGMGILENIYMFDTAIPLKEMPKVYAASDIVCMPSLNETFGMTFAEAQAMKKPVVATRTGAAPEVVKGGIFVKAKDPKSLAAALRKLILDEKLRKKLGKIGYIHVVKNFNAKRLVSDVERVYKSLEDKKIFLVRHPEA
ncbi:MAG: glycosyltransferase family 4 protein, partial [Candidatus Heimdallarchaeota archaeon]